MRHRIALILLALSIAAAALGDCSPTVVARSTTKITVSNITTDCNFGTPAAGDAVTITAGGIAIAATVVKYALVTTPIALPGILQLASTDPAPEKLTEINNQSTVTVTVGGNKATAQVLTTSPNYFQYNYSVGPAESGDAKGQSSGSSTTTTTTTSTGAIRLKLDANYASSGILGTPEIGRASCRERV